MHIIALKVTEKQIEISENYLANDNTNSKQKQLKTAV